MTDGVPSPRLTAGALDGLPRAVQRPAYPIPAARIGVVHLGVGNFFRAHQAVYLDDAMNAGERGWAVCGVSLRNPDTRDALAPQQGLYTLVERDAAGARARIIGSLRELRVAPDDPGTVIDRIAAVDTRWVMLTITEKGYGHRPAADGHDVGLDTDRPDIAHDLAHPESPCSAVGLLHAAALRRRRHGQPGLTVLSCDNLSGNGSLLRRLLQEFDRERGRQLGDWIADALRFPDTMVDRIVPRTTDADRRTARELTGCDDAWPVTTEPFRQWVIQDDFAGPRPLLERSGVQIVPDVRPFEAMKLRLLNAAHSAIAWLGLPAGLATVDAAIAVPTLRRAVTALWHDEVIPGLDPAIVPLAPAYCARLLDRFDNPGLAHRTAQIAMDGSQKLPLRVLPSIRANRRLGLPTAHLTLAVAAWIRYLGGIDEAGRPFSPEDPLATRLQPGARLPSATDAADAVLAERSVFTDLADDRAFAAAVATGLDRLRRHGSLATLAAMNAPA